MGALFNQQCWNWGNLSTGTHIHSPFCCIDSRELVVLDSRYGKPFLSTPFCHPRFYSTVTEVKIFGGLPYWQTARTIFMSVLIVICPNPFINAFNFFIPRCLHITKNFVTCSVTNCCWQLFTMVYLILLSKLWLVNTTEMLLHLVFRLHCVSRDFASNRFPQFIARS